MFLWRLGRNNLPVREALSRKGVNLPIICPFCELNAETIEHLFFSCHFAKSCWDEIGMNVSLSEGQSGSDWLLSMLTHCTKEALLKVVAVLWGIWFFRNKKVWEDKTVTARLVVTWGRTKISEWSQAKKLVQNEKVGNAVKSNQVHKWKKPEAGSFKLNVDAAVPLDEQNFSIGMLIRDSTGAFVQGKLMKFTGSISAFEAETRGV